MPDIPDFDHESEMETITGILETVKQYCKECNISFVMGFAVTQSAEALIMHVTANIHPDITPECIVVSTRLLTGAPGVTVIRLDKDEEREKVTSPEEFVVTSVKGGWQ